MEWWRRETRVWVAAGLKQGTTLAGVNHHHGTALLNVLHPLPSPSPSPSFSFPTNTLIQTPQHLSCITISDQSRWTLCFRGNTACSVIPPFKDVIVSRPTQSLATGNSAPTCPVLSNPTIIPSSTIKSRRIHHVGRA